MNWGEIIITFAGLFVLVVIVFVLKSEKKVRDEKTSRKQDQPGGQD